MKEADVKCTYCMIPLYEVQKQEKLIYGYRDQKVVAYEICILSGTCFYILFEMTKICYILIEVLIKWMYDLSVLTELYLEI